MLNREQVFAIADKFGAFEFGDAQGDKRQQFAADLIAAHQRMRDAAPDLLAALSELVEAADYMRSTCGRIFAGHPEEDDTYIHEKSAEDYLKECADKARAIVAKATGEAA